MGWWPIGRDRRDPAARPATGPDPIAPAPSPSPVPEAGWLSLPPVQRTLAEPLSPVAPLEDFRRSLATHSDPSFLAPLAHAVDPEAGGVVDGLATVRPGVPHSYPPASDLPVPAKPAARKAVRVQRSWAGAASSADPGPEPVPAAAPPVVPAAAPPVEPAAAPPVVPAAAPPVEPAAVLPVDPAAVLPVEPAAALPTEGTKPSDPGPTALVSVTPEVAGHPAQPVRPPVTVSRQAGPLPVPAAARSQPAALVPVAESGEPDATTDVGTLGHAHGPDSASFPAVQRRLASVPQPTSRRAATPALPLPLQELPVVQRLDDPGRPRGPEVRATPVPESAPSPASEPAPDADPPARRPDSDPAPPVPGTIDPGESAPLSGFAAAITALTSTEPEPVVPQDGAPPLPVLQRDTTVGSSSTAAALHPTTSATSPSTTITAEPSGVPTQPTTAVPSESPVRLGASRSSELPNLPVGLPPSPGVARVAVRCPGGPPAAADVPASSPLLTGRPPLVAAPARPATPAPQRVQPVQFLPAGPPPPVPDRNRAGSAAPRTVLQRLSPFHRAAPASAPGPILASTTTRPLGASGSSATEAPRAAIRDAVPIEDGGFESSTTPPRATLAAPPAVGLAPPPELPPAPVDGPVDEPMGWTEVVLPEPWAQSDETPATSSYPTSPAVQRLPSSTSRPARTGHPPSTGRPGARRTRAVGGTSALPVVVAGSVQRTGAASSSSGADGAGLSFSSMFASSAASDSAEPAVTPAPTTPIPVQRAVTIDEVPSPTPAPSPGPTPAGGSDAPAPPAGGAAGGSAIPSGAQLDELARRLYEPLTARLREELWLDRERAGLSGLAH